MTRTGRDFYINILPILVPFLLCLLWPLNNLWYLYDKILSITGLVCEILFEIYRERFDKEKHRQETYLHLQSNLMCVKFPICIGPA